MRVIRALCNSVADVNAPVTQGGYTHLMLASLWLKCTGGVADRMSIAELLLRSGGVTARSEDSAHRTHHRSQHILVGRRPCDRMGLASEQR